MNKLIKTIETQNAPAAIGPYSQAKVLNGILYASGQIPLSAQTGIVVGTEIKQQTEEVMKNIAGILDAANSCFENVVTCM